MRKPVINCHTHIFVGKNVPPYLGKQILFWPLYLIFNVPLILTACKFWYSNPLSPYHWQFTGSYKKWQRRLYNYRAFLKRTTVLYLIISVVDFILIYHSLIYILDWLSGVPGKNTAVAAYADKATAWLNNRHLLYKPTLPWIAPLVVLYTLLFINNGRRIIVFGLKKLFGFIGLMLDEKTLAYLKRYINIGRFAYYKESSRIFSKLQCQYEPESSFVVLPMDMTYMEAGKLSEVGSYHTQMEQLKAIKDKHPNVYPFVFIDPRRIAAERDKFLDWAPAENGSVQLKPCFVQDYIETYGFNGFKIYPALGYYPFEASLLPLWKYAADKGIPIMTHCIRGIIFYRGTKKKAWGEHPVFRQAEGDGTHPLLLPELKNEHFMNNFTHPLNYLCLVEEKLLRLVVKDAPKEVKDLFGYKDEDTKMEHDLSHLKLCFGHYGGEDEWQKFFENDRDDYTSQVVTQPAHGIYFTRSGDDKNDQMKMAKPGSRWQKGDTLQNRLEDIWKGTDWYSIVTSLLLQYDNLYADISFIIHDEGIVPLLHATMQNDQLKNKVLLGTDFYVVRNHKSDKEMIDEIETHLSDENFDLIARQNPKRYLGL